MGSTVLEREPSTALTSDGRGGKYLVFELGTEEFGIRVLTVREIMGIQNVTAVPQTPVHVKGVVDLAAADIEDTPDFGDGRMPSYLLGMAKVNGKVKILLEIERVLSRQDLADIAPLIQ